MIVRKTNEMQETTQSQDITKPIQIKPIIAFELRSQSDKDENVESKINCYKKKK